MALIQKAEQTTIQYNSSLTLQDIAKRIYDKDEIENYSIMEAINEHPLAKKPTVMRSKLAYREILRNVKPTPKYLLPGQIVLFHYAEPKFKEELEYYDKTPLTLFVGITRTNDNTIREVGINLHYFPPFTRAHIIEHSYNVFKPFFDDNFNKVTGKPNKFISYNVLKSILKRNTKIAFGVKMYIPVLRQASFVLPTRLLSTAVYTEGRFSKASLAQIYHFWRQF